MKKIMTLVFLAVTALATAWGAARPPVISEIKGLGTRDVHPRAWTELDIVPMPKNIRLTDNDLILNPDKVVLVIGADACKQSKIGADWINQRIGEVGGESVLPIIAGTELPADKTLIVIGTVDDNPLIARAVAEKIVDVGPNNPGERGYEIRTATDGNAIYLAGADNIGALYACVTFGELLTGSGTATRGTATRGTATRGTATRGTATRGTATRGTAVWRAAEVRDWPDLILMHIGMRFAGSTGDPELCALFRRVLNTAKPDETLRREYLDAIQNYYDWLLRRKITLLFYENMILRGREFKHTPNLDIIREGVEYGKDRGVGAQVHAEKPYVGLAARYPEEAASDMGLKDAGPHKGYGKWIRCWSMDDIRRVTARELAEHIRATGLTDVNFHDTDTGWYDNPAQWNERCHACRERWGDDYAAATINKHMIYVDEIQKLNPDTRVHLVFYPYLTAILDEKSGEQALIGRYGDTPAIKEMAAQYRKYYTDFWQRMDQAFPDNVTFCFREDSARPFAKARSVMPGRGFFVGFALMSHAWRPFFSEGACWSATFIDNPRDYFGWTAYLDGPIGLLPLEGLAVREYSWNKATPGVRPFDRGIVEWGEASRTSEQWRHAEPKGEIYEIILPRLARNIFGQTSAPFIVTAVSQNVDLQQIFDDQRRQFTWLSDSAKMRWQLENAARGAQALDELWKRSVASDSRLGMDDYALRRFVVLREQFHMGMWMARIRMQNLLAMELARAGNLSGAEAAIAEGLEFVRKAEAERDRLLAERPEDPVLSGRDATTWHGLWRQYTADRFTRNEERADFAPIANILQQTRAGLKDLAAAGSVPRNILDALIKNRKVSAYRAPDDFDFSDETAAADAFAKAEPVESFLVFGSEHLAQAHTRARILYDDENIYLETKAWMPGDTRVSERDVVEIFIQPPGVNGDYIHFFLYADGRLRHQYNTREVLADGIVKWQADNDWILPGVEYRMQCSEYSWTTQMKIPLGKLDLKTGGRGWRVNLMRGCIMDDTREFSSILPPAAVNAHDVASYPALDWRSGPWPGLSAQIEAPGFKVDRMTLPDSVASVAIFRLEITSDRVLHDIKLVAEAYDNDGKLQARQILTEIDRVMYRWQSPGEYVVEYRQVYQQGGILIKLVGLEGSAERWLRFGGWEGTPSSGEIYAPANSERRGVKDGFYFSDRVIDENEENVLLHGEAGTVEFWFKPARNWSGACASERLMRGARVFLHYGPISKDRPLAINNSRLTIRYTPDSGRLHASLFNHRYAGWQTHADIESWPVGVQRHVALIWDAKADASDQLRIYVDGQRKSSAPGYQNKERLPEAISAMVDAIHPFAVQIGSLNTGRQPMGGVMKALRISRVARYKDDFAAPDIPTEPDIDTTALFELKGSLLGAGMNPAGTEYQVEGVAGVVAW